MNKQTIAKSSTFCTLVLLSVSTMIMPFYCPASAETSALFIDTLNTKTGQTEGNSSISDNYKDSASANNESPGKKDTLSNETPKPVQRPKANIGLTKKVFSVATAFFVGTPVCVARRAKYEDEYGIKGMVGNSNSKLKKIVAGTFWLPFAAITGSLEAPFDAISNGVRYPAFSKDQLSVGKLAQNN